MGLSKKYGLILPSLVVCLATALAAGCSDDDGETSPDGGDTGSGGESGLGGAGSGEGLHGSFIVTLQAENPETENPAFVSFQGALRDAPPIESVPWEFAQEDGDCQLFVPAIPFCDPACASGTVCVVGDTCAPEPQPASVGPLTIDGFDVAVGESPFSIEPIGSKFNYLLPASVELEYPPAAEGAVVSLDAPGAGTAPLHVESHGISFLEVHGEEVLIAPDTPVELSWEPPGSGAESSMEIVVEISHHGGRKGKIVCDADDSGETTISAELITELINLGYAGFPTVKFSRQAVGTSDPPHQVRFVIVEHVSLPIVIDGLVSCTTDDDCEEGETCQQDRSCG